MQNSLDLSNLTLWLISRLLWRTGPDRTSYTHYREDLYRMKWCAGNVTHYLGLNSERQKRGRIRRKNFKGRALLTSRIH